MHWYVYNIYIYVPILLLKVYSIHLNIMHRWSRTSKVHVPHVGWGENLTSHEVQVERKERKKRKMTEIMSLKKGLTTQNHDLVSNCELGMKDQTWCKLGDIYITIIYPRLKESISEYFKSSLVWSWMELICLSPSRHIAMAVAFEPKKLPKVSHSFTFLNSQLDDAGCLFFGISFFDMFWRTLQRCWPMLAACVCFFSVCPTSPPNRWSLVPLCLTAALRAAVMGVGFVTLAMLDISQLSDETTQSQGFAPSGCLKCKVAYVHHKRLE